MSKKKLLGMVGIVCIGAASPVNERVVSGDGRIEARIGEVSATLRIDPGAPSMPLVTPEAAGRAGLRAGPFGISYLVGPEEVSGRTAVTHLTLADGVTIRRRVGWTTRPYAPNVDGVIGPGGLPEDVVLFTFRPAGASETTFVLPLVDQGNIDGRWGERFGMIQLGGQPLRIRFDPRQPRSLATAGAATRIALYHDGAMAGEPGSATISFGVVRPVRRMTLSRPLMIGPIAIADIDVRTMDFGTANAIPESDRDPDEIVVLGERRRNLSRDRLTLGADFLDRCSSLVFDKPRAEIRLSCA